MWKMSKTLAVCMLAAVWWGIFYPELLFSEETCALIGTKSLQDEDCSGEIDAADIWRASGDEVVVSSRFLEWWEEHFEAGERR